MEIPEKKFFDEEGNEVTGVLLDDVKVIQETAAQKDARIAELEEEIAKGGNARAERTEELRQLREAREADSAKLKTLEETIQAKTQQELESAKKTSIARFAGANEELAKKLEEEYAYINIPEDSAENIQKRFEKAAAVLGLSQEETRSNPAFSAFGGREPFLKTSQDEQTSNLGATPEGKQLLGYLGIDEK